MFAVEHQTSFQASLSSASNRYGTDATTFEYSPECIRANHQNKKKKKKKRCNHFSWWEKRCWQTMRTASQWDAADDQRIRLFGDYCSSTQTESRCRCLKREIKANTWAESPGSSFHPLPPGCQLWASLQTCARANFVFKAADATGLVRICFIPGASRCGGGGDVSTARLRWRWRKNNGCHLRPVPLASRTKSNTLKNKTTYFCRFKEWRHSSLLFPLPRQKFTVDGE